MKDTILALAKSRKFVLAMVCVLVATVFVALGKIDSSHFLDTVIAIFSGLAILIGIEDAAEKHGARDRRTSGNPPAPPPTGPPPQE